MEDFKDNSLRVFLVAGIITALLILLHGMRNDGSSGLGLLEPAAGGSIGNPAPSYKEQNEEESSIMSGEYIIALYY